MILTSPSSVSDAHRSLRTAGLDRVLGSIFRSLKNVLTQAQVINCLVFHEL